jgi:hypothetical protein
MNIRQFLNKCEWEGWEYAVSSYFSDAQIQSLPDEKLKELILQYQTAHEAIENYIRELERNTPESDEDEDEDDE